MGNILGGKGAGLYVPMSETEQEVVARLIERDDLQVVIHGWGVANKPTVSFGDLRVCIEFRVSFVKPDVPQDVWFFDLELQTRTEVSLYKERMPVNYGGKPLKAGTGLFYDLRWHIALKGMSPKLVKLLLPGTLGLTSRRQDPDTGQLTDTGNMKLDLRQKEALRSLADGEKEMRKDDLVKAVFATKSSGSPVVITKAGVVAPDLE